MNDQIEQLRAANIQQYAQYIKLRAVAIDLADAFEETVQWHDNRGWEAIEKFRRFIEKDQNKLYGLLKEKRNDIT